MENGGLAEPPKQHDGVFESISKAFGHSALADPSNWKKQSNAPGDKSGFYSGANYKVARDARNGSTLEAAATPDIGDKEFSEKSDL